MAEVLEAAHITPDHGAETNHSTNGLLLRSDVHVLFDLGLIGIDPDTNLIVTARELSDTSYADLRAGARTNADFGGLFCCSGPRTDRVVA